MTRYIASLAAYLRRPSIATLAANRKAALDAVSAAQSAGDTRALHAAREQAKAATTALLRAGAGR